MLYNGEGEKFADIKTKRISISTDPLILTNPLNSIAKLQFANTKTNKF